MTHGDSTSFMVKCSSRLPRQHEFSLCRDFLDAKADARIRTADPFITSDEGAAEKRCKSPCSPVARGLEPAVNPPLCARRKTSQDRRETPHRLAAGCAKTTRPSRSSE